MHLYNFICTLMLCSIKSFGFFFLWYLFRHMCCIGFNILTLCKGSENPDLECLYCQRFSVQNTNVHKFNIFWRSMFFSYWKFYSYFLNYIGQYVNHHYLSNKLFAHYSLESRMERDFSKYFYITTFWKTPEKILL